MEKIINYIADTLNISERHIIILLLSIFTYYFLKALQVILDKLLLKYFNNNKKQYLGIKKNHIIFNIIFVFCLIVYWSKDLKNMMTMITFVSTAFTLVLKDFILNLFAGIYIKMKKIISLEDRILIHDVKGDVINLSALNFEILEVNDKENGEQSSGIVTVVPNSYVLTYPVKNYNKAFKYIWEEINIDLPINTDIKKAKGILYKIVNENDIIKRIPQKMEKQMSQASSEYRIYYNKFKPIIYTKIIDNHIRLSVRYLMHPKKSRVVEDYIWLKTIEQFKNNEIDFC